MRSYGFARVWCESECAVFVTLGPRKPCSQGEKVSQSVSQSVISRSLPPAHPSTGSQSGSAAPVQPQVPSTRSSGLLNCRKCGQSLPANRGIPVAFCPAPLEGGIVLGNQVREGVPGRVMTRPSHSAGPCELEFVSPYTFKSRMNTRSSQVMNGYSEVPYYSNHEYHRSIHYSAPSTTDLIFNIKS